MKLKSCLVVLLFCITLLKAQPPLQRYNIDRDGISVSGFSSGSAMAVQLQVAHSALIQGCGCMAGMAYYCALGDLVNSLNCGMVGEADLDSIYQQTAQWSTTGQIDATGNLRNKRIAIFHGTNDNLHIIEAGRKNEAFFRNYGSNVVTEFSIPAGHGYPTENYGIPCGESDAPYLNRCNYYGAFFLLNHIYSNLTLPSGPQSSTGELLEFDQSEFAGNSPSFDEDGGFIYVPSACRDGTTRCRLHIALHGCTMGREFENATFAEHAGYNRVGDVNNIIIMYPQIAADLGVENPAGCWDIWGYEEEFGSQHSYPTKNGSQIQAIKSMIDRAAGM